MGHQVWYIVPANPAYLLTYFFSIVVRFDRQRSVRWSLDSIPQTSDLSSLVPCSSTPDHLPFYRKVYRLQRAAFSNPSSHSCWHCGLTTEIVARIIKSPADWLVRLGQSWSIPGRHTEVIPLSCSLAEVRVQLFATLGLLFSSSTHTLRSHRCRSTHIFSVWEDRDQHVLQPSWDIYIHFTEKTTSRRVVNLSIISLIKLATGVVMIRPISLGPYKGGQWECNNLLYHFRSITMMIFADDVSRGWALFDYWVRGFSLTFP